MKIVLELARQFRALDTNDTWQGYTIAGTVPHSGMTVLSLPPEYDAGMINLLVRDWVARGLVVDKPSPWRPEHQDYSVLWIPDRVGILANVEVGDTFPMIGVTGGPGGTQERGKYGAGVILLHLDTGMDKNHAAFLSKNIVRADPDQHGHGTHTASTAGSAWGVAPDVTIWSMNVLPGGTGSEALIANGIRQATDYAVSQRAPAVLTMSLGGSGSAVLDDAVSYARARGVITVSAAGNSGPGAPIGSPARASDLIVLAVDRARNYASFSSGPNWTNPNRVSAPGVDIMAAAANTADGTMVSSGTSMSCPQIAGHCVLLLAGG